jgi:hypothetical protein
MKTVLLSENGSVYLPVYSREARDSALYAARELSNFLSEMTGTSYPLLLSGDEPAECIALGVSPDSSLGAEGFTIKTAVNRVEISGGLPRGLIYGVYEFLEQLGCRWFSSKVSHIPSRRRLEVPAMDIRRIPKLEYRDINSPDARNGAYAVRNKFNGNQPNITGIQGGKITYYPFVHTFDSLMSPEEYYDEHPEYFSLVDGKRVRDRSDWGSRTQLCLTNPDVKRICAEKVEKWIEERPEAVIFSVSQNDWYNPCDCPDCTKLNEEEGSRAGSLIHFVNYIADHVGKKYPKVVIDTLAYQWSRKAPKHVRPRPNVCVRLCSIECCFAHPLRECEADMGFFNKAEKLQSFQKDLADWAKVCDRLYIWDYVVNFSHYLLPFPNFHVLKDNINFFIENNVKGIFEEDCNSNYTGQEFAEMRAWVLGKLLWDPDLDTDALVHEFIAGYYKAASDPLREYFHLIHDAAAKDPAAHFGIYRLPEIRFITPEIIKRSKALFRKAMALADNDDVLKRVRIAALPIRYYEIYTMPPDNPKRAGKVEHFLADCVELGVHSLREGSSFQDSAKMLRQGGEFQNLIQ